MKILLCVVTQMLNRGVDALVASKTAELRRVFPGCTVDVFTFDGDVNGPFLEARGIGLVPDVFAGWRYKLARLAGPLAPVAKRVMDKNIQKIEAQLRTYDLAVASGGDNFSSDYGSPWPYLYPLRWLQDANVPVVLLGQSIGPFRSDAHVREFMRVARDAALITVRESASYAYVTETLGLSPDKVRLTADTAFLLEPADAGLARKMLTSFGIAGDKPFIALSVSGGIAGFAAENRDLHLVALERLSRTLLARTDAQLLLIPHVEDYRPHNNDLITADALMRRLDFDSRVHLAKGFLNSNEFKALVALSDFVIAERMHVAIAGLSSAKATFVVGYSVKGHGIMSDTFGFDSIQNGLVVPLADFINDPASDEAILKAWADRDRLSAVLQARLPDIKALARANFEPLPAIVGRG